MIIIMIMNLYQETNIFWCAPDIDFRYETKARKVFVDFKLMLYTISLLREPPEVGLIEKLTGSLYWWVEQCVPTLHRESYRTL